MSATARHPGMGESPETSSGGRPLRGVAGFFFAAFSAAFCLYAILSWWHSAGIGTGQEGGAAFSANITLNLFPLLASVVGIACGIMALIVMYTSLWLRRYGRPSFSLFHFLSAILLAPAAFLLFRLLVRLGS